MISQNLNAIHSKLPQGVRLVAVSKFHPVERLQEAYDAGQRIFAESRPQELAAKVPQLPADIEWQFIGHLQTNKLKLVLPYVSLVQSVDSLHLLEAINQWGSEHDRVIPVLLELHLGAEETKQGFSENEIIVLLQRYCEGAVSDNPSSLRSSSLPLFQASDEASLSGPSHSRGHGRPRVSEAAPSPLRSNSFSHVAIRGLMGMATNTDDEAVVEADFARIEALFQRLRADFPALDDSFTELSIGMSADWPIAVRHGATMVRIGTDIFGNREY